MIIPQGADNFDHAVMCTIAGTALTVLPDQLDPATVADAVRRAIQEPGYAAAARRTAAEIDAMSGPDSAADALRAYVRTWLQRLRHRPATSRGSKRPLVTGCRKSSFARRS